MSKINLLQTTCLVLAVAAPQLALAQDASDDVIVVTGEKRGQSIQETATSIEIVSTEDIERLNIVDLEDALRRIGNAGFATVGSGANEQFLLRGVQSGGVTPGSAAVATLIVDGAFIPNQAAGATVSNAWDVNQIEILRGAQSTLQGRNSLIGAVVVNTNDPSYEWDVRGRATYAEGNTWETSAAVGGPIIDDELAFRIAAQHVESDGFITRDDGSDGDREYHTLVRGKLLIEPSSLPDLTWNLGASYVDEKDGSVLVDGADPGARLQLTDIETVTEREVLTLHSELQYDLNDQFTLFSVTSYANLKTDEVDDFDRLPDVGDPAPSIRLNERDQTDWIQELRVLYNNDAGLEVLFGGLFARQSTDDTSSVVQTVNVPTFPIFASLSDPIFQSAISQATGGAITTGSTPAGVPGFLGDDALLGPTAAFTADFDFVNESTTLAAFGEASYDITNALNFTFGFRYERQKEEFDTTQIVQFLENSDIIATSPSGSPALAAAVEAGITADLTPSEGAAAAASIAEAATPLVTAGYAELLQALASVAAGSSTNAFIPFTSAQEQTFNVFMPKFVLTYNFTDDISVAASAQRAYRPGGIGINPVQLSLFSFDPEFSWNYELAFRSLLMDGRLLLNANAFYIDWSDQQIEVQLGAEDQDEETQNVGSSELYGIELQASYDLTDNIEVFGSVGLLETEITGVDATNAALLGNRFPFAPRYSGAMGVVYDHPSGFNATVDMNFQGDSEPVLPNNSGPNPMFGTGLVNDARAIVNARFGYEFENYQVFVFGSNLFDDVYLTNADGAAGNVIVGEPRILGGGIQFDF